MMRFVRIGLAALCLAAPAAAQDGSEAIASRTPENAQKFLSVMALQHKLGVNPAPVSRASQTAHTYLFYEPVSMTSEDRCTTKITGPVSIFFATYLPHLGGGSKDPKRNEEILNQHRVDVEKQGVRLGPYTIHWVSVTGVGIYTFTNDYSGRVDRLDNMVAIVTDGGPLVFNTPSAEIASRMRHAMETLKMACDGTEGLGF